MAQMKEKVKTLEEELSNEEIDNLSDAEFKTLVIMMLTEMVEYRCKMEEKEKPIQSEIRKNIQGTNSKGKEIGTQINGLEQKEKKNPSTGTEWRNKNSKKAKNEEKLRNLWDNFKHSNIQIIGLPEGEGQEQEIENLLEKIMKEMFLNLVKEIDM